MQEAISRKTGVHSTMCPNNTEENKSRYKGIMNENAVSKAMREKAEEEFT